MKILIQNALGESVSLLRNLQNHPEDLHTIEAVIRLLTRCFEQKGKVVIFGNGGSMADAMHFAEELTGRFNQNRQALPAIALSDPAFLTCTANDFGYEEVFARGVEAYVNQGDLVIGLSTSGNSENVFRALSKAQSAGAFTFCLLGKDGGKLKGFCDYEIVVPSQDTARIQEIHMLVLHVIIAGIEKLLLEG